MVECYNRNASAIVNSSQIDLSLAQIDDVLNRFVLPAELLAGFVLQLLNLWVLQGSKIRSSTYTVYLRGLSVTYLITILFTATSILRKAKLVDPHIYLVMLYHAHFERYFQNALLFSGNLIVAALAAESLRGMLSPFSSLHATSNLRGMIILALCYSITLVVLSPVPFIGRVEGPLDDGSFCIERMQLLSTVRYAIAGVFEVALLLIILVLNAFLFVEYRRIVRRHRRGVLEMTMSTCRSLTSNGRKAILICLASVTAYSISNMPSAFKEALYLIRELTGDERLKQLLDGVVGTVLRQLANVALLFNFSLSVLIPYFMSAQYKNRVNRCLRRLRRRLLSLESDKVLDKSLVPRPSMTARPSGQLSGATPVDEREAVDWSLSLLVTIETDVVSATSLLTPTTRLRRMQEAAPPIGNPISLPLTRRN
uniref:G-protein coupled receptors family 1 profile domain-containing protein n=1 Tax=Plectus sambesii TaxID=2011161 RepID=A0A914UKK1_9BILA